MTMDGRATPSSLFLPEFTLMLRGLFRELF